MKILPTGNTFLVDAVAGAAPPEEPISWIDRVMDSVCSGVDADDPEDPPVVEGLDLSVLRKRPVMIFDNFNNVPEKDVDLFMRSFYPVVKDRKVLLFVMVRDKRTADKLLELNNWGRIAPLPTICEDVSGPDDEDKVPKWRAVEWSKAQLEAIVLGKFQMICLRSTTAQIHLTFWMRQKREQIGDRTNYNVSWSATRREFLLLRKASFEDPVVSGGCEQAVEQGSQFQDMHASNVQSTTFPRVQICTSARAQGGVRVIDGPGTVYRTVSHLGCSMQLSHCINKKLKFQRLFGTRLVLRGVSVVNHCSQARQVKTVRDKAQTPHL